MLKFFLKIIKTKIQIKQLIKYPLQTFLILLLFQFLRYYILPSRKFYSNLDIEFLFLSIKNWYILFNIIIFLALLINYIRDIKYFIKFGLKWTLREDILHHCFICSCANLIIFLILILLFQKIFSRHKWKFSFKYY